MILASLCSLHKYKSPFHRFLKMLAVFDILVVCCCLWMYSLPALSSTFKQVRPTKNSMAIFYYCLAFTFVYTRDFLFSSWLHYNIMERNVIIINCQAFDYIVTTTLLITPKCPIIISNCKRVQQRIFC